MNKPSANTVMKQGDKIKVTVWLANPPADRELERQRLADLFGVSPNEIWVESLEEFVLQDETVALGGGS